MVNEHDLDIAQFNVAAELEDPKALMRLLHGMDPVEPLIA
jgi:hypothetical protein